MGRELLKNTGRIILSFIISVFILTELYAVEVKTKLSPARISQGESAALTITVTGKSSIDPAKLPAINGLKIIYTGASYSFQFTNGKTWYGTVLNFSIYGEKTGEYTIPPFLFNTSDGQIYSEEKTLTVQVQKSSSGHGDIPITGELSLSSNTVYVGEPLIMRYYINGDDFDNIKILGLAEQPLSKDFSIKMIKENINKDDKIYAASFYVVPLKKGNYDIGENSIHIQVEDIQSFFSRNVRKIIPCSAKKINVLPIPENGKPENFSGDVGEYKIEVQTPSGEFKQFEEIKVPVKITGKGNLITLSKPKVENNIENGNDQKIIIEEKEAECRSGENGLDGEKEYLITIIPQKYGELNTGKIFIEYFNPYKKKYERAESQPLTFNVLPDEKSSGTGEVQLDSTDSAGKLNYIWLFLFIIILAVFIAALIIWEKKKLSIIKKEIKPDTADEISSTANKSDNLLRELAVSFNNKDTDLFLLNADRAINRINPSKLSNVELDKYKQFKDNIYNCRYGAGVLTNEDMKELMEWFKKNQA
ncbi:MAG: BatD family protein [Spirochaetes bacterium]|nr:BatD family protein [Spirochaetota bacterium]